MVSPASNPPNQTARFPPTDLIHISNMLTAWPEGRVYIGRVWGLMLVR